MTCPKCGTILAEGSPFCTSCGTQLAAAAAPPSPYGNPAPASPFPAGPGPQGMPPGAPGGPYGAPYGQPGYGQPGYGQPYGVPPMMPRTSGMAIAGFVLSFFCSLLGLIFSIIGYNECKRSDGQVTGDGLALAGIIISIVGMVLSFVWFMAVVSATHSHW